MGGFDFAFRDHGLDRAEPMRSSPDRLDAAWVRAKVMVLDEGGQVCVYSSEDVFYPATRISMARPENATLLGFRDEQAYFAIASNAVPFAPVQSLGIRAAAGFWPDWQTSAFAQAKALLHWQAQSKFCGRCGGLTDLRTAGYSASCAGCGLAVYPQTHPAVIMCVSDGEKILLGRQATWPEKRWSLLAGFIEPGESPEQTVVREVWEESGVKVGHVRYVASQPWPMPMGLMLGFEAYAPEQPIAISDELQAACWYGRTQLRAQIASGDLLLPDALSISRSLIMRWLDAGPQDRVFWHTEAGKGGQP